MARERTLEVPGELELIEFFGVEPMERAPQDGYWCFELKDAHGIHIRFSFKVFERSIQTALSFGGEIFETVSHELAERLHVSGDELQATFTATDAKTLLTIRVTPNIKVRWSTLRTQ